MDDALIGQWGNRSDDDFLFQIAVDFVAQLEDIMEAGNIGRTKLARKLGVSKGRVSQILNNPGNLTLKNIVYYSRALGRKVAIVTYGASSGSGDDNGPVNPQIFTTCWEKLGSPTDFLQAEMAVASTGDPVDQNYARQLRLERLERLLDAGPIYDSADTRKGKMLVVRELKRAGEQTDAGTDAA